MTVSTRFSPLRPSLRRRRDINPTTGRGPAPPQNPAVDWNTGRIVWKKQYGSGLTANKNYSSIALGPDGSLYADALIRLFRVSDGS